MVVSIRIFGVLFSITGSRFGWRFLRCMSIDLRSRHYFVLVFDRLLTLTTVFDFAQTSLLYSRGGSNRGRLQDRENVSSGGASDRDRDSFSRWRDRQYFGPRRWLESALRDTFDKDSGKAFKIFQFPISIFPFFNVGFFHFYIF